MQTNHNMVLNLQSSDILKVTSTIWLLLEEKESNFVTTIIEPYLGT